MADNWDQLNPQDANAEVTVTCDDETEWQATFYSDQNILSVTEKHRASTKFYFGQYFFVPNMLLVEAIERSLICDVVKFLIAERREVFEKTFRKVGSEDEEPKGREPCQGRSGVTIWCGG